MEVNIIYPIACKIHEQLGRNHKKEIYINALKIKFEQENIPYETNKEYEIVLDDNVLGSYKYDFYVQGTLIKIFTFEQKKNLIPEIELFKNQLKNINKSHGIIINFIKSRTNFEESENNNYFEPSKHVSICKINCNEMNTS